MEIMAAETMNAKSIIKALFRRAKWKSLPLTVYGR
jgi:hypothetical protein